MAAKVSSDGGLFMKCEDKGQRKKVMKLTKVCNKVVEIAKKTGDGRFARGVIYGRKVGGFEGKHKRW